jgi:diguanylate cyclase (GGDEF)-like protein
VEEPIETQYSRIAVKKGDIETLELINSGLIDLTEDGTVDRIMKQWQGKRVVYITEDYYRTLLLRSILLILLSVTIVVIYLLIKYQRLSKKLRDSVNERTEELNRVNNMLIAANVILEQISMIDGLTSIENRRAFDIAYQKTWRLCMRERMPLALIMIDIDHFKVFNDTYGHLAGDQALIRIAEAIKDVIRRPGDLAARYGGEEFVVMLMNTNGEVVEIVAEKIRRKVEELGIKNEKINTVLTVSLGVASIIPNDKMAAEKIIDSADKALYKAKEDGRNKIVVWQHQQE